MRGWCGRCPPSPLYISTTKKLRYTMSSSRIEYSEKYADEENEYRWVHIGCWKGRTGEREIDIPGVGGGGGGGGCYRIKCTMVG